MILTELQNEDPSNGILGDSEMAEQLVTSEDLQEEAARKREEEARILEAEEREQARLFEEEKDRCYARISYFYGIYEALKTSSSRLQVENVEAISELLV